MPDVFCSSVPARWCSCWPGAARTVRRPSSRTGLPAPRLRAKRPPPTRPPSRPTRWRPRRPTACRAASTRSCGTGDGSTLVLLGNMYDAFTHYRVYDERWRPTSPPMRVEVYLSGARGTPRGFVARATTTKPSGRYSLRECGRLSQRRAAPRRRCPGACRATGLVTRNTAWYEQPDGSGLLARRRPRSQRRPGPLVARRWPELAGDGHVRHPGESGSRLWSCSAAGDWVVVLTGGASTHTHCTRSTAVRVRSWRPWPSVTGRPSIPTRGSSSRTGASSPPRTVRAWWLPRTRAMPRWSSAPDPSAGASPRSWTTRS